MLFVADTAPWRSFLTTQRNKLREAYFLKPEPRKLLAQHTALVDELLAGLARDHALPACHAIVAVGGYGRGTLFPCSDVDIMILLDNSVPAGDHIERFIAALWDCGLEPGSSVRTIAECMQEALKDATVMTSLLEARHVWGSAPLTARLVAEIRRHIDVPAFFTAKIAEQQERHGKHHDVTHNLEPNIKESPGGLRDLQTVLWLAKAARLGDDWKALAAQQIITLQEASKIAHHERLLQDLRIRLHFIARRREDRLIFDFQTQLASQLRLEARPNKLPSEALMQRYYLTAKAIWQMNSILLQNLSAHIAVRQQDNVVPIDDEFTIVNGYLAIRDSTLFERDPVAIFRAFRALQRYQQVGFFDAATLRALWRAAPKIDKSFRQSAEANRLFLDILRGERLTFVLRRMSRYGVLGRYLPAFGRIVGQMQHDLFHVYTVDEHILMVVRNLRRLVLPRFANEFPFCHQLACAFEGVEILYLAALFHDIAKGRGGDHSRLGMADAKRFCRQLGLSTADTDLVVWLVEMHLQLSLTAQKQDLSDPEVIAQFAARVKTERRLVALYLLTVADIRGTSPQVWNAWKARLLEDLFRATRQLLRGEATPNIALVEAKKADVLKTLAPQQIEETRPVDALWAHFDDSYFQRFDGAEIAWHARLLWPDPEPGKPFVKARLSHGGEGLQVMIFSPDQPGMFARITGFFERLHFNIATAKVYTTLHGYALDDFQILSRTRGDSRYREQIQVIETGLARQLADPAFMPPAPQGRLSRQVKHIPFAPDVSIGPARKNGFVEISITCADRPGLLSTIARLFLQYAIDLHDARIATLGARAEDTFVVRCKQNDGAILEKLKEELIAVLKT